MKDLDERIREALAQDEQALAEASRNEPGMVAMALETLRGRNKFFVWMANFWMLCFFAVFVYSAVQFFHAEELKPLILWAAAAFFSMNAVSLLKMWWFMEMNKNAVMREVKRVELQVARLAGMLEEPR